MILRPLAFALALTPVVLAQQPELDVSDLVPRGGSAVGRSADFVWRGLPDASAFRDEDREMFDRHGVSGAGQLVPRTDSGFDHGAARPRAPFSDDALATILARVRGVTSGRVAIVRSGNRARLESDYPEQGVAALAKIRAALGSAVTVDVRLERVDGANATLLLSGVERAANGDVCIVADVERTNAVYDFEVEIAQAAATANPIVGEVTHGASIALRARPIPFGDDAVVEVVVRVAAPESAEPLKASNAFGPLDRVDTRVDEVGVTFRAARGQACRHEWTTLDGDRLRLTVTADWRAPEANVGTGVLVPSALFGAPVVGFRSTRRGEPEDYVDQVPVAEFVERVVDADGGGAVEYLSPEEDATGVLWLDPERAPRIAQVMRARLDADLAARTVVLEVFDAPVGVDVPVRGDVPSGVRTVARLAGPLIDGLPACFASARERTYVRDWDVEVAQAARIPDPKVRCVENGWFATVRTVRGRPARLEVTLDVTAVQSIRRVPTALSVASVALTDASDSIVLPADVVDIEIPVTRSTRVDTTLDLDEEGGAVARRVAATMLGAGRALVVRAHVE